MKTLQERLKVIKKHVKKIYISSIKIETDVNFIDITVKFIIDEIITPQLFEKIGVFRTVDIHGCISDASQRGGIYYAA